MKENPWHPLIRAALKRALPESVYLRYVGRHEHGSLVIWKQLARDVPPDRAILDIGAFHGEYALAAREANPDVAICAFEPNPASREVLTRAVEGRRIEIQGAAVAEQRGIVSFRCKGAKSMIATDGNVIVPTVSLDEWVDRTSWRPTLIKIDTEGGEAAILRGGRATISRCKPTILCEVLSDSAGEAVMAELPDYTYLRIDEDRGTEERARITRADWRHKNWLLVPH